MISLRTVCLASPAYSAGSKKNKKDKKGEKYRLVFTRNWGKYLYTTVEQKDPKGPMKGGK